MENYKHIDLLLTGYGGAGAYPQCFDNLSNNEKIKEANNKKNFFLKQALEYLKIVKPYYYLPFAGTYTLTGKLSELQDLIPQAGPSGFQFVVHLLSFPVLGVAAGSIW